MAKIIRKNNETLSSEPTDSSSKITAIILLVLAVLCGIICLYCNSVLAFLIGIVLLICSVSVLVSEYGEFAHNNSEMEQYGELGEYRAGSILEEYLPENYTVVQNSIIEFEGEQSEIDNIVVGKTGVFIIEVKNVKGEIYGDYSSRDWHQEKTDKYGYGHSKEFYSPVKQVGTHVYRLAHFLRENKVRIHITGLVYFVNADAELYIDGEQKDIPIYTCETTKEMIDYILEGTENLNDKTIEKIIKLLTLD